MTTEFTHDLPLGSTLTAHEHIGFELGWDYAHHGLTPPAPYDQEPSSLRHGLLAGQAAFGTRTLLATRHVRKWLQLRLHAWLRGRSVELVQVTPNHLQQIEVSHCPITELGIRRLQESPIEELITTDSLPQQSWDSFPITVLSVADLLGDAIKRIYGDESVSKLFEIHQGRTQ